MALSLTANLAGETTERNDLLLLENVVQVLLSTDESHALDSSADLTHVLEVCANINCTSSCNHSYVLRSIRIMVCHLYQKQQIYNNKQTKKKYKNKKKFNIFL